MPDFAWGDELAPGGLEWLTTIPMFNDFVNAGSRKMKGYVHDIGNDM